MCLARHLGTHCRPERPCAVATTALRCQPPLLPSCFQLFGHSPFLLPLPAGNVLRQARGRLEAFWTATCTAEGSFAWQAAQSFSVALMKTMQVGA